MNSNRNIPHKRDLLLAKEQKLLNSLDKESAEIETSLQSSLKTIAVVGAGLLTVVALYKLFDSGTTAQEPVKSKKKKRKASNTQPSTMTASIISTIVQKLLPVAIEKISSLNSKEEGHEQAAGSISK